MTGRAGLFAVAVLAAMPPSRGALAQSGEDAAPVRVQGRTLRIQGGAVRGRTVAARGNDVEIVVPGVAWTTQELAIEDDLVAAVRVRGRAGYGVVVLRLRRRADTSLAGLDLRPDGRDLLVTFGARVSAVVNRAKGEAADAPSAQPTHVSGVARGPLPVAPTSVTRPTRSGKGRATPPRVGRAPEPYWRRRAPATDRSASGGRSSVARLAMLLAGLAFGAALWSWRRRQTGTARARLTAGVDILWTRALSAKHKLVLVRVGMEQLLLGCADARITLLRSNAVEGAGAIPVPTGGEEPAPFAPGPAGTAGEAMPSGDPLSQAVDAQFERRLEQEIEGLRARRTGAEHAARTVAQRGRAPSEEARASSLVGHIQRSLAERQGKPVAGPTTQAPADAYPWADDILRLRRARDERRRGSIAL